jgi:hypothetical protein
MGQNRQQPTEYDAVLGGQTPAPIDAVVLGGLEGVKRRLASPVVAQRVAALSEAIKYGVDGLDLVIECLGDRSCKVRHAACLLLEKRTETRVQHALRLYNSHCNRFNSVVDRELPVKVSHIDTLMDRLEQEESATARDRVEQSLSLVQTPEGQKRLEHYLINGTKKQQQYAARFCKVKGRKDIFPETRKYG